MSVSIVVILVLTGVVVGFINTLSAGGTAISIALYLALGLEPSQANATNRIGVLLQTSYTSSYFAKQGLLKQTGVLWLSLCAMVGALAGSLLSVWLPQAVFSYAMGASLLVMVFFLFSAPEKFEKDDIEKLSQGRKPLHYIIFFLIGIYGGFVQVGTGFFLMAAGSVLLGYNIVRTNAIKACVMFFYTLVAIIVFANSGNVHWLYGLLHSAGTIAGSLVASRLAIKKGAGFVRVIVLIVILFTSLYLFKIVDLRNIFHILLY